MKLTGVICIFFLLPFSVNAQGEFKTIVPTQPITVGESFQVQYVFQGTSKILNFKDPSFRAFRFVSGPNQYTGLVNSVRGTAPITNFVFTLAATKEGWFNIPGAVATINGKLVRSNDAMIEVISKQDAVKLADQNSIIISDYILRPGEDPYQ